jgi:hypothetical protein
MVKSGMVHDVAPLFLAVMLMFLAAFTVGIALAFRYKKRELQHRERMAALEKNLPIPMGPEEPAAPRQWPRTYLLRGLIWMFTGFGLAVFLLAVSLATNRPRPMSSIVWEATNAKNQGATEEQIRNIMNDRQTTGMPPALALFGLIPAGVGAAYLITYRVEKANEQRASS